MNGKRDVLRKILVVARKFTSFIFVAAMILSVLACVISATEAEARQTTSNSYVEIAVDETTGTYTIGTTGGDPSTTADNNKVLLYGHPSPGTSYLTVRIDGTDYVQVSDVPNGLGMGSYLVSGPLVVSNSIITKWLINDVNVTQTISIVTSTTTGNPDTAAFEITLTNSGSSAHDVGVRFLFDTMLGLNDMAPFRVPGTGEVTTETEYSASNMPDYWQAFDSLESPTIIAQGTLKTNTPPDRFVLANWDNLYHAPWDYSVQSGEPNADSATAVYGNPVTLQPGQSKTYMTAYGLGGVTTTAGVLKIGVTAPLEVSIDEEFTVTAYIQNTGGSTATDVEATVILPSVYSLAAGETATRPIGDMESREEKQIDWVVKASTLGDFTYNLIVNSTNTDFNSAERSITVQGVTPSPTPSPTATPTPMTPTKMVTLTAAPALADGLDIVADGYSASVYADIEHAHCSFAWDERGQLYVACLDGTLTGHVTRGQREVPVLSSGRCSSVAVADGYIFTADDYSGALFKISISDGEADTTWNYHYPYGGDRDPGGMLIVPDGFRGTNVRPGDLLVLDRDYNAYSENAIFVFPTSGGDGKVLIGRHDLLDECAAMAFGPDSYLYTIGNAGLWKIDAEGHPTKLMDNKNAYGWGLAVHPSSGAIVLSNGRELHLVNPSDGSYQVLAKGAFDGFNHLAFSPSGTLFVCDTNHKRIFEISGGSFQADATSVPTATPRVTPTPTATPTPTPKPKVTPTPTPGVAHPVGVSILNESTMEISIKNAGDIRACKCENIQILDVEGKMLWSGDLAPGEFHRLQIRMMPPVDSDGDGWTDEQEYSARTDPLNKDTDGDGLWDPVDSDPLVPLPLEILPTGAAPIMSLSQTTLKEEPEVGEECLITVSIRNAGDGIAKNVQIDEKIPSSVAVSYVDGADKSGNRVTWSGDLNPRQSHSIQHTFKVLELKNRVFPVKMTYVDAQGKKGEAYSTVYISTKVPDPSEEDSDWDGWTDAQERYIGTNPYAKDTDGDSIRDPIDPNPLKAEVQMKFVAVIGIAIIVLLAVAYLLLKRKRSFHKKEKS